MDEDEGEDHLCGLGGFGGVVGEGGFGLRIWFGGGGGGLWAERRCGGGSGIRGALVSGILRLVSLPTCDYG